VLQGSVGCRSPPNQRSEPSFSKKHTDKGAFMMNTNLDMKKYVIELLEAYSDNERKIDLLHYELEHAGKVTPDDMLDVMSFARASGEGHPSGGVSNKTLYIALNYQEAAENLNLEARNDIVTRLVPLERQNSKLKHYLSLLPKDEQEVIRLLYFEKNSLREAAEFLNTSPWSVRIRRDKAIDALTKMYAFVEDSFDEK
jgi:RNA polymerase sigma factor (sigma-70 family)